MFSIVCLLKPFTVPLDRRRGLEYSNVTLITFLDTFTNARVRFFSGILTILEDELPL